MRIEITAADAPLAAVGACGVASGAGADSADADCAEADCAEVDGGSAVVAVAAVVAEADGAWMLAARLAWTAEKETKGAVGEGLAEVSAGADRDAAEPVEPVEPACPAVPASWPVKAWAKVPFAPEPVAPEPVALETPPPAELAPML